MERAISEMEKIRRAEEIYSKRRNGEYTYSLDNENKNKVKSFYKILFQLLFLFNIAVIIVAVQNKEFIFTKNFLKEVNRYNIDIKAKINEFLNYINSQEIDNINKKNSEIQNEDIKKENANNKDVETKDINTNELDNIEKINEKSESSALGNVEEINLIVENNALEKTKEIDNVENISLSQMDIDVKNIKDKYSFILPVSGIKTSSFGVREPNEIVTKYHTGVDIANNKGTVIKSAITGKVIQVSEKGDYGKHLKISVDDLITVYAHCDKIYVKEGDEIIQGQDIAEMGSTGNSTGNHLHFEIRYENRYIDPERLLNI